MITAFEKMAARDLRAAALALESGETLVAKLLTLDATLSLYAGTLEDCRATASQRRLAKAAIDQMGKLNQGGRSVVAMESFRNAVTAAEDTGATRFFAEDR